MPVAGRAEAVATSICVLNGLLVVAHSLTCGAYLRIDAPELAVGGGAVLVVVWGQEVQCTPDTGDRGVEVGLHLGVRSVSGTGSHQPAVGDVGEGSVGGRATEKILVEREIELAFVPPLSLIEVSQYEVRVAEVAGARGLTGSIADAFVEVVLCLEVRQAGGHVALHSQEPTQVLFAYREVTEQVAGR